MVDYHLGFGHSKVGKSKAMYLALDFNATLQGVCTANRKFDE